ncbi:MAG TPA: hypothetical protein VG796_07235 [Verrucomicrobiales bacterium]|nr:hypothetical protein [Verrucomicrobiales bacterium]
MSPRPKHRTEAHEPSAFEIARIALHWLPPPELPEDWRSNLDKLSLTLLKEMTPRGPRQTNPYADVRSPFEVLCQGAVDRARALFAVINGNATPESIQQDALRKQDEKKLADSREAAAEFDKIAKGEDSISLGRFLQHAIGEVKNAQTRLFYFEQFVRSRTADKDLGKIKGWLAKWTFSRVRFGSELPQFLEAYAVEKDAWRRLRAAKTGAKGMRRRKAKEGRDRAISTWMPGSGPAIGPEDS